jgi:hypothetical protein
MSSAVDETYGQSPGYVRGVDEKSRIGRRLFPPILRSKFGLEAKHISFGSFQPLISGIDTDFQESHLLQFFTAVPQEGLTRSGKAGWC